MRLPKRLMMQVEKVDYCFSSLFQRRGSVFKIKLYYYSVKRDFDLFIYATVEPSVKKPYYSFIPSPSLPLVMAPIELVVDFSTVFIFRGGRAMGGARTGSPASRPRRYSTMYCKAPH